MDIVEIKSKLKTYSKSSTISYMDRYLLANNCGVALDENGEELFLSEKQIAYLAIDLRLYKDERLEIATTITEDMINNYVRYYFNYAEKFKEYLNKGIIGTPKVINHAVTMLDMGYLPVVVPPTFLEDDIYHQLEQHVLRTKIEYVKTRPTKLRTGSSLVVSNWDIWVSKIKAASLLGCKVEDVTAYNLVKEIFSR